MRRGQAAFSSHRLSAGHTSCHKMQGLSCSFLGVTCQEKHRGGAGTSCYTGYYSLSQPPKPHTHALWWISENRSRRQRIGEGRNIKRALWGQSPERALNREFQVEKCCHLATHSGSAC